MAVLPEKWLLIPVVDGAPRRGEAALASLVQIRPCEGWCGGDFVPANARERLCPGCQDRRLLAMKRAHDAKYRRRQREEW